MLGLLFRPGPDPHDYSTRNCSRCLVAIFRSRSSVVTNHRAAEASANASRGPNPRAASARVRSRVAGLRRDHPDRARKSLRFVTPSSLARTGRSAGISSKLAAAEWGKGVVDQLAQHLARHARPARLYPLQPLPDAAVLRDLREREESVSTADTIAPSYPTRSCSPPSCTSSMR
jgi:hypothetical protein